MTASTRSASAWAFGRAPTSDSLYATTPSRCGASASQRPGLDRRYGRRGPVQGETTGNWHIECAISGNAMRDRTQSPRGKGAEAIQFLNGLFQNYD